MRPLRDEMAALAATVDERDEADRYGEGALLGNFETEIARLLGKEAAVFMPSGTMAQQIALRIWAEHSGRHAVGFHPTCHLELHERQGYQLLHRLSARLIGAADRLITMDDLRAAPEPLAALLLELPQREIGGQLPAWDELIEHTAWARSRGAAAHMDGARLWEAAPAYGRDYAEVAALFDSVYVSFYKGVGAIAGAALAGGAEFIAEARLWQRRHGGNLIHLYPYVLSARACLSERLLRFPEYHARALEIAAALRQVDGVALKPDPPHAHMAHVYLRGDADALLDASAELARDARIALFTWLRPSGVPGHVMFEMSIGDGAAALTPDEIASSFARVMQRARELAGD
jgi:threonine aldolase